MYCPGCGAEYREGFTACATCGTELVEELSPEEKPEYINFVTVLRTGNPAIIAFAKSILTSEDIVHFVKGECLQDLFAGGRIGTGCNLVTGCVEIQVDKNDVEIAEQLLADIEEAAPETYYDKEDVQESPELTSGSSQVKGFLRGLIAGALITGSLFFYYDWKEEHLTETIEYDRISKENFRQPG